MFGKSKSKMKAGEEEEEDTITTSPQLLTPKRTFYIIPHTGFTKTIQVLDLTGLTKTPHTSENDFQNEVKEIIKKSSQPPWLSITRTPHWYSKSFLIHKGAPKDEAGASATPIANWKGGMFSASENIITFPELSPYCSHPITLKADSVWKFREHFVKNSVTYEWKPDNVLTNQRKFTLYRIIGKEKVEVGRYLQGWSFKYGGVLVIDDSEVGDVVAVTSMVSVLRKKRQKDAENHSG
jgi:hypothetical protein